MPQAVSMAVRLSLVASYSQGKNISTLAKDFKISRKTVRELLKRHQSLGIEGLKPNYRHCGKSRRDGDDLVFRAARCLRTWHPTWGGEKIRSELLLLRPDLKLPHPRTFVRWFHQSGQLEPRLKNLLPESPKRLAQRLHEVWQIDAKEEIRTTDGNKQCWLNIVDEYSGMTVPSGVFPPQEDFRGAHKGGAGTLDLDICPKRPSPMDQSGQRTTFWRPELGVDSALGPVVGVFGHKGDLEPPGDAKGQRQGRAWAKDNGQLDRVRQVP